MTSLEEVLASAKLPVAFTLPIPCQICLGQVTEPWTCCNQHVFCQKCIQTWLDRQNRCPVCRVEITPQSPIKPIIGGRLKADATVNRKTERDLRRTRMDLILKGYDEDIADLEGTITKQNLQIKGLEANRKNSTSNTCTSLIMGLMDAGAATTSSHCTCCSCTGVDHKEHNYLVGGKKSPTPEQAQLEQLKQENNKLQKDLEALKKENFQIRDRMLLQSPTKLSRATVATLEAQLESAKRESYQLRKALSRSDAYTDQLQAEISKLNPSKPPPQAPNTGGKSGEKRKRVVPTLVPVKAVPDYKVLKDNTSVERSSALRTRLMFDMENSQPISIQSIDESTNQSSKSSFISQNESSNSSVTTVATVAATPTKELALCEPQPILKEEPVVWPTNFDADGLINCEELTLQMDRYGDMNSNQMDCENLLRQFDENMGNNANGGPFFDIDDFIEPSSSSSLSSELRKCFTSKSYLDEEVKSVQEGTIRSTNQFYQSPVANDVLLSQDCSPKKRARYGVDSSKLFLPLAPYKTTTISAGSSRITMSRLSPEDQSLFDRPSSAPSKTFLLNSSLFSSIQPIDDNGVKLESTGNNSFSMKDKQSSGFQPYKKGNVSNVRGKQKAKKQTIKLNSNNNSNSVTTTSAAVTHSVTNTILKGARSRSLSVITGQKILSKSPYNLVAPDDVMVNDRKLIKGITAVMSKAGNGNLSLSATCSQTSDARGKNMYRVNILKKGATTPRSKRAATAIQVAMSTAVAIPTTPNPPSLQMTTATVMVTPPPSLNTRGRRKQKLTEKRLAGVPSPKIEST